MNIIRNKLSLNAFAVISCPILLYTVIIIIYTFICIYFFIDPILCQGEISTLTESEQWVQEATRESVNLIDLKANLKKAVKEYDEFRIDYYQWTSIFKQVNFSQSAKLLNEICNRLGEDRSHLDNLNGKLADHILSKYTLLLNSVEEIRKKEIIIKNLDPNFTSSIKKLWFE